MASTVACRPFAVPGVRSPFPASVSDLASVLVKRENATGSARSTLCSSPSGCPILVREILVA